MREALRLSEKEIKNSAGKTPGRSGRYNENVISRDLYRAAKEKKERQSRLITSKEQTSVSGEISNEYELSDAESVENDRQYAKELRAEEAQIAYVQAYRKYDPQFTKNKGDDLIAITRPPFLAFSSAAKEVKRLYGVMVNARANVAHENENKKIQANLAAEGEIKFQDSESGLKPVTREAFRRANEAEERAADIKRKQTDSEIDRFMAKAGERKARQK